MNDLLERYYNDCVRDVMGDREFVDLSEEDKKMIEGMWGFAFFKASEALKEAKQKVKEALCLN
jgi:hypothetical protein